MPKTHNKANIPEKVKVNMFSIDRTTVWMIIIPALAFTVYQSVRHFDLVSWDDKLYVKETPIVRGLTSENVKAMFTQKVLRSYNPIVLISFAVDYEIAKLDPKWSHLVNLIFHLLNALLVFACMRKLKFRTEVAGLIAALFAIHPLSVEAVAWVAGRKDMLYGFFFLLAWLFYLRYKESGRTSNYLIALVLFTFSLLSKVQAITLPFILIISDYILAGNLTRRSLLDKIPFILLSLIIGIVAISGSNLVADKYSIVPTFADKIIFSIMAVGLYLFKLILPFSQSAIYSFPEPGSSQYFNLLIGGIATSVLLIALAIYSMVKKARIFAGGILFFLVSIFVVLHVVAFNSSLIYERFTYLAGIGIFISLLHIDQLWPGFAKYRFKVLGTAVLVYAIVCFFRVQVWKDSETLWSDVILKNPNSAVGWNNRGMVYYEKGEFDKALLDFNECIRVQPKHPDAYNNRSIIYYHRKDYPKALEENLKLLNIDTAHKEGYSNRGSFFYIMQQYDSSKYYYLKATQVNGKNASAYFYAGVSEYNLKSYRNATGLLHKAISLLPNYADAYVFLGICYTRLGLKDSVLYSITKAEEVAPLSAARQSAAREYQLAGTEAFNRGDWQEALSLYNEALSIKPDDADALYYIGGVYLSRQNVNKAREYWKKSIAINPQQKEANEWLAKIGN